MRMYTRKYCTFIATCFFLSATGQNKTSILTVLEKDPDLFYKKNGAAFTNKPFADINSMLHISISKDNLMQAISPGKMPGVPQEVMKTIAALQTFLDRQNAFIQEFKYAIRSYTGQESGEAAKAFNSVMNGLANQIATVQRIDPVIEEYVSQSRSNDRFGIFFEAAERRLDELRRQVAAESSTLQMGAWLIRSGTPSQVHLPGFDKVPKGEYYEIARWNFFPSQAQLQQIDAFRQSSKAASINFQDLMKQAVESLEAQLKKMAGLLLPEPVVQAFQTLLQVDDSILSPAVKSKISDLKKTIEEDARFIIARWKYYESVLSGPIDIITVGLQASGDVSDVEKKIKDLKDLVAASKNTLEAALNQTSGNIQQALTVLNGYLAEIPEKITGLVNSIGKQGFLDIKNNYALDIKALEFSEDILKLSLKDAPEDTELDLKWVGQRSDGDRIVIKLLVRTNTGPAGQVLASDESNIELQRLNAHVEGTVGVVLAAPVAPTALPSGVQVAPYYNVLFKGVLKQKQEKYRSRGNTNNILALNLGLHASVPDFNLDGVPEIGLGPVASWLKDYLQGGWAYNFFEKTGYWFIGARFPIGPFGANSSAASKNIQ